MMNTKYVIQSQKLSRPDLEYFYIGQSTSGAPIFDYKKYRAKRYTSWEEADRDRRILMIVAEDETLTVETIRCRM
jgi:hypothetical protein